MPATNAGTGDIARGARVEARPASVPSSGRATDRERPFPFTDKPFRREIVMRVHLRHRLAAMVVAVAVGLLGAPAATADPHAAETLCPHGTNWDSVLQRCR